MRLVIAGATGTVGRHVVTAATTRGHKVVELSRSSGHDIIRGDGLAQAMAGADAVVDVTSTVTTSAAKATAFFTTVTANLHEAEREAGIAHHVALSIVGIDTFDAGYYAGKLAHERMVREGPVPWSILRASQFHEFAEQIARRGSLGPFVAVPKILMRPVAAREVGARLVDIAENTAVGRATDLTGPSNERLVELIRRMYAFDGINRHAVELALPGKYWRGSASGRLRGDDGASRGRISFDEWLASADHRPG
jgi:uncharacterized protein YbjT (DUF2867 family)